MFGRPVLERHEGLAEAVHERIGQVLDDHWLALRATSARRDSGVSDEAEQGGYAIRALDDVCIEIAYSKDTKETGRGVRGLLNIGEEAYEGICEGDWSV